MEIRFLEPDELRRESGRRRSAWLPLQTPLRSAALVSRDGCRILADGSGRDEAALGALVRSWIPFASYLQGRGILHAAAVARGSTVFAFVGASGAGKSTLASALAARGFEKLADDLLPFRITSSRAELPAGAESGPRRLAALCFLARRRELETTALRLLGRRESFCELTRHGWGEAALRPLWSAQFDQFATLAERVPAFRLQLPDRPSRLVRSAAEVAEFLG